MRGRKGATEGGGEGEGFFFKVKNGRNYYGTSG